MVYNPPMAISILATKLYVPPTRRELVPRHKLKHQSFEIARQLMHFIKVLPMLSLFRWMRDKFS
jgi:hypothetical protein